MWGTASIPYLFFFFQAEDGIRDVAVTGVQTCALPISVRPRVRRRDRKELRLARLRIEPAVQVRALDGEPDLAVVIQRRVRVARLGGQRVLLDRARRRGEPGGPAFEVGGIPHGTTGVDDESGR